MKPGRLPVRDLLDRTPAAYVVLLGTVLLTLLAWYYVDQNVENQERARFDETVIMIEEAIDQRMDAYVDAMLDSRGLFYPSSSVGQDEWRDYVAGSNLTSRYPGIQALGYIERVRPEQRDDNLQRVREEARPPTSCGPLANATSPSPLRTSSLRAGVKKLEYPTSVCRRRKGCIPFTPHDRLLSVTLYAAGFASKAGMISSP